MNQLEVMFCGNSVYLSGLAAGLRQVRQLRVIQVDDPVDKALNDLKLLRPDVVVVETVSAGLVSDLLKENADLLVIGVDTEADSLAVLSGGPSLVASAGDLTQIILGNVERTECGQQGVGSK